MSDNSSFHKQFFYIGQVAMYAAVVYLFYNLTQGLMHNNRDIYLYDMVIAGITIVLLGFWRKTQRKLHKTRPMRIMNVVTTTIVIASFVLHFGLFVLVDIMKYGPEVWGW